MAKLLYLVPGIGLDEEERKRREELANTFLTSNHNRVAVATVEEGPISIESSVEEVMSIPGTLKKIIQVQDANDAIIIGCAGDPGLAPARELSKIPVIGPIETSFYTALMLADNFSIITVLDTIVPAIRRTLREYGLEERCASIRVINIPVLNIMKSKESVAEAFLKEVRAATAEDGTASIILGCMSMAFGMVDEMVGDQVDVPIINPAKTAIKAAEMIVSLGLKQSRVSYPRPDLRKLMNSVFKNDKP